MAELAIHDPHYFNVESDQKTAIVHLFHNPIPADGPRDEGPGWARMVDDIYLKAKLNGPFMENFFDVRILMSIAGNMNEVKLQPPIIPDPVRIRFRNNTSGVVKMCGLVNGYLSAPTPCCLEYQPGVGEYSEYATIGIDNNRYLVFTSEDDSLGFFDNQSGDELPVETTPLSWCTGYYIRIPSGLVSREIVIKSV